MSKYHILFYQISHKEIDTNATTTKQTPATTQTKLLKHSVSLQIRPINHKLSLVGVCFAYVLHLGETPKRCLRVTGDCKLQGPIPEVLNSLRVITDMTQTPLT